jgi:hypothetical protein
VLFKQTCPARPPARPITIPQVMTLTTLADVRKLLGHIPKERRQLSTWQHVEATLQACAAGNDPVNISVALQNRAAGPARALSGLSQSPGCWLTMAAWPAR